ncbi:hypothetical protein pdam_00023632 [Pocillopora damicornis]|uniref:Uncharacterized protein n=1 Tax=Pocillopora damicornis TaxID=46731 RepID=A0A3M6UVT2_POCDA|nr:hypothetical protein pdam_00023632 [Pocillopora damicornis]
MVTISCWAAVTPCLMGLEALTDKGSFIPIRKLHSLIKYMDHEASICLFMRARHKCSYPRAKSISCSCASCALGGNTNVKGEGGAVGLTENPSALRRWMFEGSNNQTEENDHHEQKSGIQKAFCKDVLNTLSSFKNLATRS